VKQITTLSELCKAATDGRAVVCPTQRAWKSPSPAAFVQNLQGVIINRMIKGGMFLYEKRPPLKCKTFTSTVYAKKEG